MSPRISVIMPTKDRAGRLPAAVAEVLRQTERDLELLVIDDGSTDETPALVERLAHDDARIRYIRRDNSSGPAAARNAGLREAQGELIAFADDDDAWFPRKMELQLNYLNDNPSVGIVASFFEWFNEQTGRAAPFRGPVGYPMRALLWSCFPGGTSTAVVRRSSFRELLLFDESAPPCEDWDYWLRASDEALVETLPEVLYRMVFHGEAQSAFDRERRIRGHRHFVAKHEQRMTPTCRTYHAARLRLLNTGSESERLRLHLKFLATLPWRARRIVAQETLSARAGTRAGDPGRGQRTLMRLIESDL